jgi:predicted nucleotidyltransferase
MDKGTALEHARRYAEIVFEGLSPCKVVLFGSLVNGNFNENSDIDIAVVKDNLGENYWDLSKKLNRLTRNIDTRIEPILLQADDDRSGFLTTILTVGVEL